MKTGKLIGIFIVLSILSIHLKAQIEISTNQTLSAKQQSIVQIAALTAKGELEALKPALNKGLDAGLTVNEIKEVLVHLYAYCGFPRSIRGLQTFMEVLDERKAKGMNDKTGADVSPINQEQSKYERGKKVLGELTNVPQEGPPRGYGAFAPVMDTFLKEHLFADIFERDVLTYAERELVTISVISAIGGAEPMLRSHLAICLNVGLSPQQLNEFVDVIKSTLGEKEAEDAQIVLDEVIKNRQSQ
jgi:alkylhydroperoxidase/carboxymuconolactone decarboxylase family protein YurZ